MNRAQSLPGWLIAVGLALPLLGIGGPLIEIDDARYAEIPRAMVAGGEWIVPRLNGMPYIEKPPLWYWLSAASIKIFSTHEWSARLPMFLLALLGAGGAFWLASWLFTREIGRTALIATATSGLWLFLVHNLTLDLPVSVFLLWTTALILRVLERPQDAAWAGPAAWIAAALAFLCKGLIAWMFPVGWLLLLVALNPSWRTPARKLLSPLGAGCAFALCAPWLWLVQQQRSDFFHVFFLEQHFLRYLTPRYDRPGPWWYYAALLPVAVIPWTVPFAVQLLRACRRPLADPRITALAAWVIGVTGFFTFSHSKLATYILPVLPHAAILGAVALNDGLPDRAKSFGRFIGITLIIIGGLAALASLMTGKAAALIPAEMSNAPLPQILLWAATFLVSLGAAQAWGFRSERTIYILSVGGILGGVALFGGLSAASPLLSAKALARAVGAAAQPKDEIWAYNTFLHGLPFYSERQVDKMIYFIGEFHYAKRDPAYASRFGDDDDIRRLPRLDGKIYVAMKTRDRRHFETLPRAGLITRWTAFGPWSLAEIAEADPRPPLLDSRRR